MISDKTLYRTQEGKVVEEGDENAAFLLVAKGAEIPEADAVKYGLITKEEAVEKAGESALTTAMTAPPRPSVRFNDEKTQVYIDGLLFVREDKIDEYAALNPSGDPTDADPALKAGNETETGTEDKGNTPTILPEFDFLTDDQRESLADAGFDSKEKVDEAGDDELLKVAGIGPVTVDKLRGR